MSDWEKEAQDWMDKLNMLDIVILNNIVFHKVHAEHTHTIKEIEGIIEGMKKLPYYARPTQNRNGMDYCSTCEQAWEQCSCAARNTGYKKAISDILSALKEKGV